MFTPLTPSKKPIDSGISTIPRQLTILEQILMYGRHWGIATSGDANTTITNGDATRDIYITNINISVSVTHVAATIDQTIVLELDENTLATVNFNNNEQTAGVVSNLSFPIPVRLRGGSVIKIICDSNPLVDSVFLISVVGYDMLKAYRFT